MPTAYNEVSTGLFVDILAPSVGDIRIDDIAHHLASIGRSNGGFDRFYSVAEHSTLVSRMMRSHGADSKMQLAGLMHDAHETYLGDITRPVALAINILANSQIIPRLKATFDAKICERFGITLDDLHSPGVKHWDDVALAVEAYWLLPSRGVGEHWCFLPPVETQLLTRYRPVGQMPKVARQHFLATYNRIVGEINGEV